MCEQLAQQSPLPEQVPTRSADVVVGNAPDTWGDNLRPTPDDVRREYVRALADPAHAHAICEEYRALGTIDRLHDEVDRVSGLKVRCPLLVLWSGKGPLDTWYQSQAGPLGIWRQWSDNVSGQAIPGGHFFPEQAPVATATALRSVFGASLLWTDGD